MKLKKILPLVFALAIACPAFADFTPTPESSSATTTFNLTLSKFCRVTTNTASDTATASYNAEYTELQLSKALATTFHIVTNDTAQNISVVAKTNGKDALFKIAENSYGLAFANTTHEPASDTAYTNITAEGASPAIANNPNVIAFTLTGFTMTPSATYGGSVTTDTQSQNLRSYVLENGTYDLAMTLNRLAMDGTVSTHDSEGTYTTIITVTATPSA